jgi:hypothetical protein
VLRARVEPQRRLHGCSSLRRTGFFRDAASPTDAVPNAGARRGERRASASVWRYRENRGGVPSARLRV